MRWPSKVLKSKVIKALAWPEVRPYAPTWLYGSFLIRRISGGWCTPKPRNKAAIEMEKFVAWATSCTSCFLSPWTPHNGAFLICWNFKSSTRVELQTNALYIVIERLQKWHPWNVVNRYSLKNHYEYYVWKTADRNCKCDACVFEWLLNNLYATGVLRILQETVCLHDTCTKENTVRLTRMLKHPYVEKHLKHTNTIKHNT